MYKFYFKNTNKLLPSYFHSFTLNCHDNSQPDHNLRKNIPRRECYVQCIKYQYLCVKLLKKILTADRHIHYVILLTILSP